MEEYDGRVRIDARIDSDAYFEQIDRINASLSKLETKLNSMSATMQSSFNINAENTTQQLESVNAGVNNLSENIRNSMGSGDVIEQYMNRNEKAANKWLKEMNQLKQSLKDMEAQGIYAGDDEYDETYIRLVQLTDQVNKYKKTLVDAAINQDEGFENLQRDIENAKAKLQELSARGMGAGNEEYDQAYKELLKANSELKNYENNLKKAAAAEEILSQNNNSLEGTIRKYRAELDILETKGLGIGNEEYDLLYQKWNDAKRALAEYKKELETYHEPQSAQSEYETDNMDRDTEESTSLFGKLLMAAKNAFNSIRNGSIDSQREINSMNTGLRRVAGRLAGMARNMLSFRNYTRGSRREVNLMNTGLGKVVKRISSMAKTILFFRIFRTGLNNLRTYIGNLLKSNSQLVNSLSSIKGNLKTAFTPIYEAALPAINALLQGLVKLTGYLAQLTTTIFGKSIKATQAQAKAYDKVGQSAKKANKQVAEYDELSIIQKNDDATSGSDSDGIGTTYGNIELSGWLSDLLEQLKQGNFEDVGSMIAEKINSSLESIDWSKIQNTANQFGTNIARFLNGAVDALDFNLIGQTIGNGINTALEFALGFVETFNWSRMGEQLSNGVNGFFESVDWGGASTLISEGANGLLTEIRSFLQGVDWTNIGWSAAELINGILNINWGDVSGSISDFLSGFFDTLIAMLSETDWEQLGRDVVDFLVGVDWLTLLEKLGDVILLALWGIGTAILSGFETFGEYLSDGLLDGLIEGLIALKDWIKEKFTKYIVDPVKKLLGINSPSKVFAEIGKYVIEGFKNGVNNCITALMTVFQNLVDKITEKFSKLWNSIKNIFSNIGSWFTDKKNDICNAFKSIDTWFKDKFNSAWTKIKNIFNFATIKSHFQNICETIKNVFTSIPQWFENKFKEAWTKVKNVFSSGGKVFSGIKEGIESTFKSVVNTLITGINTIITKPFNAINSMLNSIRNVSIAGVKPFHLLWSKNPITVPQIPYLAKGAVIPPNKEFLAVLGDQRSGTNIEAPAKLIKQMTKEALQEADINGTDDVEVTVNVYLEGESEGIFKIVKTEYSKEKKRKPNKPVWEG